MYRETGKGEAMSRNHGSITVEDFPDEEVADIWPGNQQPGVKKDVVRWVKDPDGEAMERRRSRVRYHYPTGYRCGRKQIL